jgi:hypothetical protein
MIVQIAVLLAVLLQMFPKDSRFAFLDKPLRKETTAPEDNGDTISISTTESVWTVRNALMVGLLSLAIIFSVVFGRRSAEAI